MDSIILVRDALLKSHASVGSPDALLVGLSGGADSVALLVCLRDVAQEKNLRLHAIHVNHNLRENAASDEAFCRQLCDELNVPLTVASVTIPAKGSVEANAREVRYAAFREAIEKTNSDVLVLAHHMDDQAETVVMHLLYGSGSTGLGGMHSLSGNIWRPFLDIRRETLRDYLLKSGFSWREDESNTDQAYTRNRIRAGIMPALESVAPEATPAIARTAKIIRAEDEFLCSVAEGWIRKYASTGVFSYLPASDLAKVHLALQRRILRAFAERIGVTLDFDQTERVRCLLQRESGSSENLPAGGIAFRGEKYLHFLPDGWNAKRRYELSPLLISMNNEAVKDGYEQPLPEIQSENLTLRTRQPGDYIQPFGMKGTKSLKEYMIERGIERPFRDGWPLVCRDQEVLWVVGVGASEKLRVSDTLAPECKLIYAGKLPDQL